MHLSDTFIQSVQVIHVLSVCVPWELNPQPFALLTQCSTAEPHELYEIVIIFKLIFVNHIEQE